MMTQMMEEVDHKYRTYLHERGLPVPKPVDLSGCVNACAAPAPETPEQLIETEEGEVSEGPAPPAAPAPLPPPGPSAALIGPPPTLREYTEERIHTGPEGVHREIVRGVETEPVPVNRNPDDTLRQLDASYAALAFFAVGLDGVVVDPAKASDPNEPCHATTYTNSKGQEEVLAFHPGIVGLLSQSQVAKYCPPGARVAFQGSRKFKEHLEKFKEVSKGCAEAEQGESGEVSLADRFACMQRGLSKHGIQLGTIPGVTTD
jgi:hypothetical protein